jgi:hypothetical protein
VKVTRDIEANLRAESDIQEHDVRSQVTGPSHGLRAGRRKLEKDVIAGVRDLENARDAGRLRRPDRAWTVEEWLTHWVDNIAQPAVRY